MTTIVRLNRGRHVEMTPGMQSEPLLVVGTKRSAMQCDSSNAQVSARCGTNTNIHAMHHTAFSTPHAHISTAAWSHEQARRGGGQTINNENQMRHSERPTQGLDGPLMSAHPTPNPDGYHRDLNLRGRPILCACQFGAPKRHATANAVSHL